MNKRDFIKLLVIIVFVGSVFSLIPANTAWAGQSYQTVPTEKPSPTPTGLPTATQEPEPANTERPAATLKPAVTATSDNRPASQDPTQTFAPTETQKPVMVETATVENQQSVVTISLPTETAAVSNSGQTPQSASTATTASTAVAGVGTTSQPSTTQYYLCWLFPILLLFALGLFLGLRKPAPKH